MRAGDYAYDYGEIWMMEGLCGGKEAEYVLKVEKRVELACVGLVFGGK